MDQVPLISFVICSRNDDYVDGMLVRQQAALDILADQLNEFEIPAEIIFVDWNSPKDRPGLLQALKWPISGQFVSSRVIVVNNEIHRRFLHSEYLGMHAALGLNVGIRRAEGQFILPKSADTFYSDEVVQYLGSTNLRGTSFYRCERCDVPSSILNLTEKGREAFLRGCGDSVLQRYQRPNVPKGYGIPALHTNASGDFLLMAKENWWQIRGFKEWDSVVSLDVDGLAIHAAHAAGIRETDLPNSCVVFKPIHSLLTGDRQKRQFVHPSAAVCGLMELLRLPSTWRIRTRAALDYPRRIMDGVPGVRFPSYARNFLEPARKMVGVWEAAILNAPNWGLAKETLKMVRTCEAGWQQGPHRNQAIEGARE